MDPHGLYGDLYLAAPAAPPPAGVMGIGPPGPEPLPDELMLGVTGLDDGPDAAPLALFGAHEHADALTFYPHAALSAAATSSSAAPATTSQAVPLSQHLLGAAAAPAVHGDQGSAVGTAVAPRGALIWHDGLASAAINPQPPGQQQQALGATLSTPERGPFPADLGSYPASGPAPPHARTGAELPYASKPARRGGTKRRLAHADGGMAPVPPQLHPKQRQAEEGGGGWAGAALAATRSLPNLSSQLYDPAPGAAPLGLAFAEPPRVTKAQALAAGGMHLFTLASSAQPSPALSPLPPWEPAPDRAPERERERERPPSGAPPAGRAPVLGAPLAAGGGFGADMPSPAPLQASFSSPAVYGTLLAGADIEQMQRTISRLDAATRLTLMESFYRLSRSAGAAAPRPPPPPRAPALEPGPPAGRPTDSSEGVAAAVCADAAAPGSGPGRAAALGQPLRLGPPGPLEEHWPPAAPAPLQAAAPEPGKAAPEALLEPRAPQTLYTVASAPQQPPAPAQEALLAPRGPAEPAAARTTSPSPPAGSSPAASPARPRAAARRSGDGGGREERKAGGGKRGFSAEQTSVLNGHFAAKAASGTPFSPAEISAVAAEVRLTEHQVRVYFQNRRARSRKALSPPPPPPHPTSAGLAARPGPVPGPLDAAPPKHGRRREDASPPSPAADGQEGPQ